MENIDTINAYLADSGDTVEEQPTDQDAALQQAYQEFYQVPSYVDRFKDGREPIA